MHKNISNSLLQFAKRTVKCHVRNNTNAKDPQYITQPQPR